MHKSIYRIKAKFPVRLLRALGNLTLGFTSLKEKSKAWRKEDAECLAAMDSLIPSK